MRLPRGLPRCVCGLAPGTRVCQCRAGVQAQHGAEHRSPEDNEPGQLGGRVLGRGELPGRVCWHMPTGVRTAVGLACAGAVRIQCSALPRNPAQGPREQREGLDCCDPALPAPLTPTGPAPADSSRSTLPAIAPSSRIRLSRPARSVHSAPGGRGRPGYPRPRPRVQPLFPSTPPP